MILFMLLLLAAASPVFAQDVEYRMSLNRNFGYGGGGNVRGDFTSKVVGPAENIASVTYLIDGQEMAVVSEAPFTFRYNTGSYPSGWHELVAVVTTKDGRQVTTPVVKANFLSAEQETQAMQKILIPTFGGIIAALLIGMAIQFLVLRRSPERLAPGAPRHYGFKGGTICPRCGRAYALHFWSVNLGPWKLDRCDYCGKVALVTRRSPDVLAAAEQAEMDALRAGENSLPGAENAQSEEERLKKLLDESRYQE
jgi:hypothetical protein